MKKMTQWISEMFSPEQFNDLDIFAIGEALNNSDIRQRWFLAVLEEIKRINVDVDRRLLAGSEFGIMDLCARRKALQDVLELVLSIKRQARQEDRHNPRPSVINLDRVTA